MGPGLLWWLTGKESACNAETRDQSLGQEGSPEKEMTTHSSVLAWEILWTEEPGGLQSMGRGTANGRAQLTEHAHTHISLFLTHTHT